MPPVKAVLDTNVLISAFLKETGREALIFGLARARRFIPVVSDDLIEEYQDVLGRPGFSFDPHKVKKVLQEFLKQAEHARSPLRSARAAYDADDDMVLDCAISGGAAYLVTGNIRHFPKTFRDIRIVPPREFLVILAAAIG